MSDGRPPQVLVLCTANVCRSPTAALLLHHRLRPRDGGPGVEVRTAGTDAHEGGRYCDAAAALVGPGAAGLVAGHASRAVDADLLGDADLVLVMGRRHRAAVARLLPTAGARTFTLREAAALALAVPAGGGLDDLPAFVRSLHAARGTVVVPPHPRTLADRLRRSPVVDGLDVPDAHEDAGTSHRLVLDLLEPAVTTLASRLRA